MRAHQSAITEHEMNNNRQGILSCRGGPDDTCEPEDTCPRNDHWFLSPVSCNSIVSQPLGFSSEMKSQNNCRTLPHRVTDNSFSPSLHSIQRIPWLNGRDFLVTICYILLYKMMRTSSGETAGTSITFVAPINQVLVATSPGIHWSWEEGVTWITS